MNCNTIEWIVDIFGTTELLEMLINSFALDVSKDISKRKELKKKITNLSDGIYFNKGHWYSVKNNIKKDSYSLKYQIKGTAHFCQTFAMLIYLEETSLLKPYKYANNIAVAINFWIKIFKTKPLILDYVIREIKTSIYVKKNYVLKFKKKSILLKNIKKKNLIQFLKLIKSKAQIFVSCKEG